MVGAQDARSRVSAALAAAALVDRRQGGIALLVAGADAVNAVLGSEHHLPVLHVRGAARAGDLPQIFNRDAAAAASMTCVGYGPPD